MTILSSTVAITMAADSVASSNDQQQQLWYPDFPSDYESGSCTTTPSKALLAFAQSAVNDPDVNSLASADKESCCETWFPHQELCGCLGGCFPIGDENDNVEAAAAAGAQQESQGGSQYWYPEFDATYEGGLCVKAGVNTNNAPPSYFTKEGGFLLDTMDACCQQWFENQEDNKCLNAMRMNAPTITDGQPTVFMTGVNRSSTLAAEAVVEASDASIYYQGSGSSAHMAEESL